MLDLVYYTYVSGPQAQLAAVHPVALNGVHAFRLHTNDKTKLCIHGGRGSIATVKPVVNLTSTVQE